MISIPRRADTSTSASWPIKDAEEDLDTYKKTHTAQKRTVHEEQINPNKPYHGVIGWVFGYKTIPVRPGTHEVDFAQLPLKDFIKAPELDMVKTLKDTTPSSLVLDTVMAVNEFMKSFHGFYEDALNELFPYLVSPYMWKSLVKSKLERDYDVLIDQIPDEQRDWKAVSTCAEKVLQLQAIRQEVKMLLFGFKAQPDEDPMSYVKGFCDL
ncbi:hypothetical protein BGX33_001252 [Mortierella sp. NVP41]|nr:hypothetical protein BGX33_001252 [Mortierella sp. NVP41]